MDRTVDTLRELGAGFAFVGRQVHFEVDGDDFYIDLLSFHVTQLRYVVVGSAGHRPFARRRGYPAVLLVQRALAPDEVDALVLGGRHEPGTGVVRHALQTPAVNLVGAANVIWCAVQHMPDGGRIVSVASRGGSRTTDLRGQQGSTGLVRTVTGPGAGTAAHRGDDDRARVDGHRHGGGFAARADGRQPTQ